MGGGGGRTHGHGTDMTNIKFKLSVDLLHTSVVYMHTHKNYIYSENGSFCDLYKTFTNCMLHYTILRFYWVHLTGIPLFIPKLNSKSFFPISETLTRRNHQNDLMWPPVHHRPLLFIWKRTALTLIITNWFREYSRSS